MRPHSPYSKKRRTMFGAALIALTLFAGCSSNNAESPDATSDEDDTGAATNEYDLEAAKNEGELVVWHNDQEADMVDFLAGFTEKTGIKTVQLKIAPAEALTKLRLEKQAGVSGVDVFQSSPDIHAQLENQDALLQFEAPNLGDYAEQYRSADPGYWTA